MSHSRTIISIPGHNGAKGSSNISGADTSAMRDCKSIRLQGRMIAGVLYSVSRNLLGEIFPVYIGKNIIGSGPDCDICLRERSVYDSHAILLVRKLTDENGVTHTTVSLSEIAPGAGTKLNGTMLEYDRMYCNSGDAIQIGDNYHLSLHLLSPETTGMGVSDEFDPLPELEETKSAFFEAGPEASMYGEAPSYRDTIGEDDERSFYAPSKAKQKDHLSTKTIVENK